MTNPTSLISVEQIEPRILLVRGQRVILDADLAELYETTTKAFNQAVKRNLERFPADFMFQLTTEEAQAMRSRIVTASKRNIPVVARSSDRVTPWQAPVVGRGGARPTTRCGTGGG